MGLLRAASIITQISRAQISRATGAMGPSIGTVASDHAAGVANPRGARSSEGVQGTLQAPLKGPFARLWAPPRSQWPLFEQDGVRGVTVLVQLLAVCLISYKGRASPMTQKTIKTANLVTGVLAALFVALRTVMLVTLPASSTVASAWLVRYLLTSSCVLTYLLTCLLYLLTSSLFRPLALLSASLSLRLGLGP